MTTRHDGEADPDLREKGIASAVVRYIEAHENASLTVLILLFLLYAVTTAIRRPFWYDEMFSYTLATLPTWRDIHVAMPPDGNPPLFTFLARLFLPWLRPVELALRMPSVLAYTASLPITFLMMRRHFGVLQCGTNHQRDTVAYEICEPPSTES